MTPCSHGSLPPWPHSPLPSPRAFIFSVENAVCEDSYRRQCRRNRLLRSLPVSGTFGSTSAGISTSCTTSTASTPTPHTTSATPDTHSPRFPAPSAARMRWTVIQYVGPNHLGLCPAALPAPRIPRWPHRCCVIASLRIPASSAAAPPGPPSTAGPAVASHCARRPPPLLHHCVITASLRHCVTTASLRWWRGLRRTGTRGTSGRMSPTAGARRQQPRSSLTNSLSTGCGVQKMAASLYDMATMAAVVAAAAHHHMTRPPCRV